MAMAMEVTASIFKDAQFSCIKVWGMATEFRWGNLLELLSVEDLQGMEEYIMIDFREMNSEDSWFMNRSSRGVSY
jgi:hypothetical protein